MQKEEAIERIDLLRVLSKPERAELISDLILEDHPEDSHVIRMGDLGNDVIFIAHGRLHVTRAAENGKEVTLAELKAGSFCGEIAALTGGDRSAFVIAASDCTVLRVKKEVFEKKLLTNPAFSQALLKSMAQRIRDASQQISDLALLDVAGRLERYLYSTSELTSERNGFSRVILRRPTHQAIAQRIGTSREVVSRLLSKLEDEGDIAVSANKLFLR